MLLTIAAVNASAKGVKAVKPAKPPVALTFRPVFHRMPAFSTLLASGDYTVLVPPEDSDGPSTIVDQATGQSRALVFGGAGCTPQKLASPWLAWECATPGIFPTYTLQNIAKLQTLPLPLGIPGQVGSQWAQYAFQQYGNEHNPTTREFYNLSTGAVVQDSSRIGGRLYPDLDDPDLYRTACRPVTLGSSPDGPARTFEPGGLEFFGHTAVQTGQDGTSFGGLQRCGSHTVLKLGFIPLAANRRVLAGIDEGYRIEGIVPSTEQRFTIAVPSAIQQMGVGGLLLNTRTLYVSTDTYGVDYRVNLPKPLR